jgi:hypothetical protein
MTPFEFVFSLFGLLLGLSLAEILGGIVRSLKARRRIRVGWLTPLLGLFVMLDLISFWMGAWAARDVIPVSFGALLAGLATTGLYYVCSALVFPDEVDKWPDFDAYYFEHRRQVFGGIWGCNLLVFILSFWMRHIVPSALAIAVDLAPTLLVAAAMFGRSRVVSAIALVALNGFVLLVWTTGFLRLLWSLL